MQRRTLIKTAWLASTALVVASSYSISIANEAIQNPASKVRKGYINGPFGQIHYYQTGAIDQPCLILVHQSPQSGRMFEKALPLLGAYGIRAVAVDLPGFGNSDAPSSPPSIEDYASILPAVLSGLGVKSAHLLGHHTGSAIVGHFATHNPQYVESVILNGPSLFSKEFLDAPRSIKPEPHPIYKDGRHLQEAWDRRVKYTPGWSDERIMHRRLVDQLWAGDTSWYGHNAAFSYYMEPDFMALKSRAMILTNTGDDIYELAQKAHKMRPELEYVELQGGTHDIVDEQPEAWSKAVADFVLKSK